MKEIVDRETWQPVAVDMKELDAFVQSHAGIGVVDQYDDQLEEVFLLRNPKYRFDKNYKAELGVFRADADAGKWFYFPWLNTIMHFLPEEMHYEVRTGRNRYLIDPEEQKKYYNAHIGVLGMSVGSHVALAITLTGGGKHIKLADPDVISASNTNRIRVGFQNLGLSKPKSVARQIYEINPYAEVEIHPEGATEENLADFVAKPKLDVLVEEMDAPYFKLKAREIARANGVPVIMAADNGDGNIVDVERYDLEPNAPLLHGILGDATSEQFKNIPPQALPGVIAKMAGANFAVPRMLRSVPEVGKTIYSWPQLGTAANLCGTTLAYLARRVVLRAPNIKSGRYEVSLDAIFESDYRDLADARKQQFEEFLKKMQAES